MVEVAGKAKLIHPILLEKAVSLATLCQERLAPYMAGRTLRPVITDLFRDPRAQEEKYMKGLSRAKPFQSYHNFFLAFHLSWYDTEKKVFDWKSYDIFKTVQHICDASNLGLTTGIKWTTEQGVVEDWLHFEWRILTLNECRQYWEQLKNLTPNFRRMMFCDLVTAKYCDRSLESFLTTG